jgi:hypothetical protein
MSLLVGVCDVGIHELVGMRNPFKFINIAEPMIPLRYLFGQRCEIDALDGQSRWCSCFASPQSET